MKKSNNSNSQKYTWHIQKVIAGEVIFVKPLKNAITASKVCKIHKKDRGTQSSSSIQGQKCFCVGPWRSNKNQILIFEACIMLSISWIIIMFHYNNYSCVWNWIFGKTLEDFL